MPSTRPLNATAASLLGFLHGGPASGWDLLRIARLSIGRFWSITASQVYRELATMEANGLVAAGPNGARDRRPFEITDVGRAEFAAWIRAEPGDEQIRHPLLLTISFGRHLPAGLLDEFVADHRARHAARLGDYREALAGDGDPYTRATIEFGARYEQAVLEWFDAIGELDLGGPAGAPTAPPVGETTSR